jgi:hypothetical protein
MYLSQYFYSAWTNLREAITTLPKARSLPAAVQLFAKAHASSLLGSGLASCGLVVSARNVQALRCDQQLLKEADAVVKPITAIRELLIEPKEARAEQGLTPKVKSVADCKAACVGLRTGVNSPRAALEALTGRSRNIINPILVNLGQLESLADEKTFVHRAFVEWIKTRFGQAINQACQSLTTIAEGGSKRAGTAQKLAQWLQRRVLGAGEEDLLANYQNGTGLWFPINGTRSDLASNYRLVGLQNLGDESMKCREEALAARREYQSHLEKLCKEGRTEVVNFCNAVADTLAILKKSDHTTYTAQIDLVGELLLRDVEAVEYCPNLLGHLGRLERAIGELNSAHRNAHSGAAKYDLKPPVQVLDASTRRKLAPSTTDPASQAYREACSKTFRSLQTEAQQLRQSAEKIGSLQAALDQIDIVMGQIEEKFQSFNPIADLSSAETSQFETVVQGLVNQLRSVAPTVAALFAEAMPAAFFAELVELQKIAGKIDNELQISARAQTIRRQSIDRDGGGRILRCELKSQGELVWEQDRSVVQIGEVEKSLTAAEAEFNTLRTEVAEHVKRLRALHSVRLWAPALLGILGGVVVARLPSLRSFGGQLVARFNALRA